MASMTIELSDHDMEYLKRGNEILKTSISGLIVVVKYKV